MRRITRPFLAFGLMASLAAPAAAQEVRFVSVTRPEFGGALGALVGALGGDTETRTTTYIDGGRMRVDANGVSTIFDYDAGRLITLDHAARRYTEMSLADVQQMAAAAAASGQAQLERESPEELRVALRVERPGERQTIGGAQAERYHLVLETSTAYAGNDPRVEVARGRLVVFVDSWRSTDSPIHRALAAIQGREAAAFGQLSGGAFAADPRFAEAMRAAAEAARELEGAPLREVMTLYVVPEGEEFDLAAAISGADARGGGGPDLGAAVGQALGGRLGGALGGLFGGGRGQRQPDPEPAPEVTGTQMRLVTVTTEVVEIEERVDDAVFQIPEGYTHAEEGGLRD